MQIKTYIKHVQKFIPKIQKFLKEDMLINFFPQEKIDFLQKLCICEINKFTRNYAYLRWLYDFFIYF